MATQSSTASASQWNPGTAVAQTLTMGREAAGAREPAIRPPAPRIGPGATPTAPSQDTELPTADAPAYEVTSTPLEIWEGKVLNVDSAEQVMKVSLSAKMGKYPDHTAEIDFEWIADQDMDLVRPGSIFYWILYKETRHGSIRNSQELRFRRFPTWSRHQIKRMREVASLVLTKTKPARQFNPRIG